jgi:hypothetical protein
VCTWQNRGTRIGHATKVLISRVFCSYPIGELYYNMVNWSSSDCAIQNSSLTIEGCGGSGYARTYGRATVSSHSKNRSYDLIHGAQCTKCIIKKQHEIRTHFECREQWQPFRAWNERMLYMARNPAQRSQSIIVYIST